VYSGHTIMFFHFVPASYSLSDLSLRASPWSWATIELGMTMAGLSRNLEIWNCPSLSQLLSSLKGSYFAVVFDCNCQTAAEYVAEMKEQEEVGLLTPHLHREFKLYSQLRLWQRCSICFNVATHTVSWLCPTCTYVLQFCVHYKFVSTIMGSE